MGRLGGAGLVREDAIQVGSHTEVRSLADRRQEEMARRQLRYESGVLKTGQGLKSISQTSRNK